MDRPCYCARLRTCFSHPKPSPLCAVSNHEFRDVEPSSYYNSHLKLSFWSSLNSRFSSHCCLPHQTVLIVDRSKWSCIYDLLLFSLHSSCLFRLRDLVSYFTGCVPFNCNSQWWECNALDSLSTACSRSGGYLPIWYHTFIWGAFLFRISLSLLWILITLPWRALFPLLSRIKARLAFSLILECITSLWWWTWLCTVWSQLQSESRE